MVNVQKLELDYAIWLGMVITNIQQDSYVITLESYKVEVRWWNPTIASKDLKVLYKKFLNKKQQWVVGVEKI